MPCRFASIAGFRAIGTALCRLGAWLGVVALAVQLLVPLNAVQAAPWVRQGLFPPTCSVHQADQDTADQDGCRQCPLCQAQTGIRLVPPPARTVRQAVAPVVAVIFPQFGEDVPFVPATHPPLPSRGPPAA